MKKKLIALAVAAATTAPALTLADVQIYGRAHVSVDYLQQDVSKGGKAAGEKDYDEVNLSSNSSRIGFKGNHEINPNLKAYFQIEQEINFTSGGDSSWNTRDTFVGLSGNFGKIQAGRFDSPFKKARGPANLFGDQVGDMRNLTRAGDGRFDERYDNTIQYSTPKFNGFGADIAYSLHEGEWHENNEDSDSISVALNYSNGPLTAALAYEAVEDDAVRGDRDGIRLAAAYQITDAIKAVGFYQTVDYDDKTATKEARDNSTADVFGLGGEFKVAKNTAVKAMWMTRDSDGDNMDSDMWVLGVEHKLDKAVRVYANLAMVDNDDNANLNPWAQARTAKENLGNNYNGEDGMAFSVGLRYDF